MRAHLTVSISCLLLASTAAADVKLPALFTDHMVLQRDTNVPVWGWADPGEEVTVSILKQQVVTKADKDGRWRVALAPLAAGGPHVLTVRGNNTLELEDVLVGEVWICSGQSNMEWRVRQSMNPRLEARAAKFPKIRLFKVPRDASPEPRKDTKAKWMRCTPGTVPDFSAVGYYFGRDLHRNLHQGLHRVPIGLIQSAWGGTRVEAWTSLPKLRKTATAEPVLAHWDTVVERYPDARKKHDANLKTWQNAASKARKEGKRPPRRPRGPEGPRSRHRPANLFNGMIAPLVPFAIRGAIWYQGESNASRAYQYRGLFRALIEDWRAQWKRDDLPFLFVQLANFTVRRNKLSWAELREAQTMALALPNTGMAVTIDVGNPRDIHPKNKQAVGHRLARCARANVYKEEGVVFSGPMYESMRVDGKSAILAFRHVHSGLVVRGKQLLGFEIAGEDRKFHKAAAKVELDTVRVSSDAVAKPVAVRYGWLDNPQCNLFNRAGLPASPFRTDDWPGVTANRKKP